MLAKNCATWNSTAAHDVRCRGQKQEGEVEFQKAKTGSSVRKRSQNAKANWTLSVTSAF